MIQTLSHREREGPVRASEREGEGLRPSRLELPQYAFDHILKFLEHLPIPEPDDAIARPLEDFAPASVVLGSVDVLRAVQLDHQPGFQAKEVRDVPVDRLLS